MSGRVVRTANDIIKTVENYLEKSYKGSSIIEIFRKNL